MEGPHFGAFLFGASLKIHKQYAAGDLVRIASLPRKNGDSPVWTPDPHGEYVGLVIDESQQRVQHRALVGQCLVVKLSTGELVPLSANMLEPVLTTRR
mgnify:CR=1 FL=1